MSVQVDARATHTAVLALVPAAEPVVGALRDELDPSAPQGVPAHVTVLFPFVPARAVDDGTVATLRRAVREVAPFSFRLDAVGWFGDDFVWLAPNPPEPFAELTERTARAFPDHPPYEGEHEPVPHLTVGYRRHSSLRGAACRRGAARAEPPDHGRGRPRPPARRGVRRRVLARRGRGAAARRRVRHPGRDAVSR